MMLTVDNKREMGSVVRYGVVEASCIDVTGLDCSVVAAPFDLDVDLISYQ